MDPYDRPVRVPYSSPYNPFPHALLTREPKPPEAGMPLRRLEVTAPGEAGASRGSS